MQIRQFFKETKNGKNYGDKNQGKNLVYRAINQLNKIPNESHFQSIQLNNRLDVFELVSLSAEC